MPTALLVPLLSSAKVVIGQACRFVGQQAVQLHGGMGVTDHHLEQVAGSLS